MILPNRQQASCVPDRRIAVDRGSPRSEPHAGTEAMGQWHRVDPVLSENSIRRESSRLPVVVRPPASPRGQSWRTFLRNHTVWAADFVQTYDIWFTAPAALPRSARAVVPPGMRPLGFIIRDRDDKFTAPAALPRCARAVDLRATRPVPGLRALRFGAEFDRVAKGAGTKVIRTAAKAPLMKRDHGTTYRERQARSPRPRHHPG